LMPDGDDRECCAHGRAHRALELRAILSG